MTLTRDLVFTKENIWKNRNIEQLILQYKKRTLGKKGEKKHGTSKLYKKEHGDLAWNFNLILFTQNKF